MSFADRLRGAVRPARPVLAESAGEIGLAGAAIEDVLDGEWREWRGHPYLVIERRFPPGSRHGNLSVGDAAPPPGGDGSWPSLAVLDASLGSRPLLFVDLETTGLAGGAGTYPFLVGCGWFEGCSFRVRQFLLATYAAERGLLEELAGCAAAAGAVATYNGKTFDVPLIETRFALYRMPPPFDGLPHVDLLHPARRLWRPGADATFDTTGTARRSCCLTAMEEMVLGYAREGDVPGFEIPSRYFHYVRTGDARPLDGVLEHNRQDLLSLALLTSHAACLLEGGAEAVRTPREALGLGRLYQRAGRFDEARACFDRAVSMTAPACEETLSIHADALRACALAARRAGRHDDAADAWRRILRLQPCPVALAQEASEALAVHHEHRLREFHVAHGFALTSLRFSTTAPQASGVRHRLTRLERKLGRTSPSPLFNG